DGGRLSAVSPDPGPREDPSQPPAAYARTPTHCGESHLLELLVPVQSPGHLVLELWDAQLTSRLRPGLRPASDGTLTLDLVQEEDGCDAFRVSVEKPASRPSPVGAVCSGRSQSLPREAAASWETGPGKHLAAAVRNRCASVDLILTHPEDQPPGRPSPVASPIHRLQELIRQKLEATERLLTEARAQKEAGQRKRRGS
ncbi:unnamed protein product, partial [Tetraodon nigroviridis]